MGGISRKWCPECKCKACFHYMYSLVVFAEPNTVSLRNCLDDWFKQKNLKQPVFDNTEEAHGSKVTFSVNVPCSNPSEDNAISVLYAKDVLSLTHFSLSDWEDSMEVAKEKLVDELKKRLTYLAD